MNTMKIILLIVNVLILISVVSGFVVLKKLLSDNSSENNQETQKTKQINKYIYIVAFSIILLSFIAITVGIFSKISF